jgi:formamidopyrimidine-DNA glycosylase
MVMPELPEIASRASEMQQHLSGRMITSVEVLQPKCLNEPVEKFQEHISGALIRATSYRGKWILTELDKGWLLLNLGMGGEILLRQKDDLPNKYRIIFDFNDGEILTVNFWWFGFTHFYSPQDLNNHPQISKLGRNALDVDVNDLEALTNRRKTAIKSILLDQTCIAGIGNAYIHDILFMAHLHPLRPSNSLSPLELDQLHGAIHRGLEPSLAKGGAFYELNLMGEKGGFKFEDIQVGYREAQPCPVCQTPIIKIKTGSNSSFICPNCQPL